jgi:putative flippase GtrA
MLLASSAAFSKTFGLIVTFGGIGVIVNIIIVYILVQVRGEHRQNEEYRASGRPPGAA